MNTIQRIEKGAMDDETAGAVVNRCGAPPIAMDTALVTPTHGWAHPSGLHAVLWAIGDPALISTSDILQANVLAGLAALTVAVMAALYLYRRRRAREQGAARHPQAAQERRRQELLHKLTFFYSSLRHVYNKYPPDQLPPVLQAERQVFLDKNFRNLTALSALTLPELEDLFSAVQRECTTGKWQGGVAALERRVDEAARADCGREGEPGIATDAVDGRGENQADRRGD